MSRTITSFSDIDVALVRFAQRAHRSNGLLFIATQDDWRAAAELHRLDLGLVSQLDGVAVFNLNMAGVVVALCWPGIWNEAIAV